MPKKFCGSRYVFLCRLPATVQFLSSQLRVLSALPRANGRTVNLCAAAYGKFLAGTLSVDCGKLKAREMWKWPCGSAIYLQHLSTQHQDEPQGLHRRHHTHEMPLISREIW
ncbi:hypothetical protein AVEN_23511-1 [Araneus ventricosus]|uniref:Uncharacterized protein n=1 Tax=Araneus ventricosus TaxID=182803 RepID=A0A4Y2TH08_ARAVE|nr:hypothetical protein AVEN_23511-1 [Araneus ventricosus]